MLRQPKTLNLPELQWTTLKNGDHVGDCAGYQIKIDWWIEPGQGTCTIGLPSQSHGQAFDDLTVDAAKAEASTKLKEHLTNRYENAWHTAREMEEYFK